MMALLFMMALAHPASAWLGLTLGGPWIYATLILSVGVYPLLEALLPKCSSTLAQDGLSCALAEAIMHLSALCCLALAGSMLVNVTRRAWTPTELLVLSYSVGLSTGSIGITLAHELMHRRPLLSRMLCLALLLLANYPQFKLQHLRRHHLLVGLPTDPATARPGQHIYAFYLQSLFKGSADIWRSECTRHGLSGWSRWDPRRNLAVRYTLYQGLVYTAIGGLFGSLALLMFMLQGMTAIFVLETINYIQHYGLARTSGKVRVAYWHAWDSQAVSNYALFNLGLHATHHVNPTLPFHALMSYPQTPKLPAGYFTMAFLAMFPPLWKRVMDPRIDPSTKEHLYD